MSGWGGKKANVVFAKPEEPSFLKKFKEKAGYKESSGVSDKFQVMPKATDEDLEDGDDELPQVVQLNPGDISQEEYEEYLEKDNEDKVDSKSKKEEDGSEGGRILFRHAEKRSREENELKASTKKPKNIPSEDKREKKKDKKKEKSNKKLLSFVDEDDLDDST